MPCFPLCLDERVSFGSSMPDSLLCVGCVGEETDNLSSSQVITAKSKSSQEPAPSELHQGDSCTPEPRLGAHAVIG